jgi:hypothetical protein
MIRTCLPVLFLGLVLALASSGWAVNMDPQATSRNLFSSTPRLRDLAIAEIQRRGGVVVVDRTTVVPPVVSVRLAGEKIDDGALRSLELLPDLRALDLQGTQISNDGLARLKALTGLQSLALSRNRKLSDAGLRNLKDMKTLQSLCVGPNEFSATALDELKKALPQLAVAPQGGTPNRLLAQNVAVRQLLAAPVLNALPLRAALMLRQGGPVMGGKVIVAQNLAGTPPAAIHLSGARRLVNSVERGCWSADGREYAYVTSTSNGQCSLHVIETATRRDRLLVADAHDPAWSPGKGEWVAFERRPEDRTRPAEIWIVASSGGEPKKICQGSFPSWSADAKSLYCVSIPRNKIIVVHPHGPAAEVENVADLKGTIYPAISPDGARTVFLDGPKMCVAELKTGKTIQSSPITGFEGFLAAFSADGKRVAYGSFGGKNSVGLWVLDVASGRRARLADGQYTMPAWSPDGSKFAFQYRGPQESSTWTVEASELTRLLDDAAKETAFR